MKAEQIKQFLEHPHEGFEKLAFAYRQATAQRIQSQQKLAAAQQALAAAQQEAVRASAYEKGLFDAVTALEAVLSPPTPPGLTTTRLAQTTQGDEP